MITLYYRLKYRGESDMILHHKRGIYSIVNKIKNDERDHLDYPNWDHRNKYPGKFFIFLTVMLFETVKGAVLLPSFFFSFVFLLFFLSLICA